MGEVGGFAPPIVNRETASGVDKGWGSTLSTLSTNHGLVERVDKVDRRCVRATLFM